MANRWTALAAIVLLVGLVGGCGPADATPTAPILGPARIALPQQSPWATYPPTCPAALARGLLVADADWGVAFVRDGTSATTKVIWPYGYSAMPGPPVEVLNEAGVVVAHAGDVVSLPGGGVVDGEWWVCPGLDAPGA